MTRENAAWERNMTFNPKAFTMRHLILQPKGYEEKNLK